MENTKINSITKEGMKALYVATNGAIEENINHEVTAEEELSFIKTMGKFTDRELDTIKYRIFEQKTLEETAKIFGVTRERIRQIESKALRKFRFYAQIEKQQKNDSDIINLDLSVRTYNVLRRARINSIEELSTKTLDDLRSVRMMNEEGIKEIVDVLKTRGIVLNEE